MNPNGFKSVGILELSCKTHIAYALLGDRIKIETGVSPKIFSYGLQPLYAFCLVMGKRILYIRRKSDLMEVLQADMNAYCPICGM